MPRKAPTEAMLALAQDPTIGYGGTGMSLAELDELSPPEREAVLMETLMLYNEKIDGLTFLRNQSREILLSDMRRPERRALVAMAGGFQVRLTPRRKFTYDIEALKGLRRHDPVTGDCLVKPGNGPCPCYLSQAEMDRLMTREDDWTINRVEMKALKERGGEIAQILETACLEETIGWDVEVSRHTIKKKAERKPEVAVVISREVD